MVDIDSSYRIKQNSLDINTDRFGQTGNVFQKNDQTISKLFSGNGYSQIDSALTSTLYGVDIFGTGSPAQQTHEQFGLTFFTRPMLNLSYDNIIMDRTLTPMLSKEPLSIGRYVRAMLDPLGNWECPLVDATNVFMPLLSNTVESLAGWQDPIIDTYQSTAGLKKESWSIADSSNKVYGIMSLSSSFRNTRGNILGYLFHVWQTERALEYEIARQNRVLDEGGALVQETRMWDDASGVTRSMRTKEGARDYRYYLEMDLAPIEAKPEYVAKVKENLPEMPWDKRDRFIEQYGLSLEESQQITEQREMADYYEKCVASGAPAAKAANWIKTEIQRVLNDKAQDIKTFSLKAETLGELISKIEKKELSNTQAKDVFAAMVNDSISLDEALEKCGASGGRLTGASLEEVIKKIFDAEPSAVETVRSGQDKKGAKVKFLQGLVMREARGAADPAEEASLVRTLLQ